MRKSKIDPRVKEALSRIWTVQLLRFEDEPEVVVKTEIDDTFITTNDSFPKIEECLLTTIQNLNNPKENNYKKVQMSMKKSQLGSGRRKFKCTICQQLFISSGGFKQHQLIHTGEKPFKCSFCGRRFRGRGELKAHEKLHSERIREFICESCNKGFFTQKYLRRHLLTHKGQLPHKCPYCNKSFMDNHGVQKHMVIHTLERPHECSVCHATFGFKDSLKSHIRTHTKQRPYKCRSCDMGFTCMSNRTRHEQIHKKEEDRQKFECPECHKQFTVKATLEMHLRLHTGELPYKCKYNKCRKRFRTNNNAVRHFRREHLSERPYPCTKCEKAYYRRYELTHHSKIHAD